MRQFTNNEKIIIEYLIKHNGTWIAPSVIARDADKVEHCCSWASHICLKLTDFGILEHNILGQYCYNKGTLRSERLFTGNITLNQNKHKNAETKIKCPNGDTYTISTLANGIQIKKNSNNDEKISISTCKGDRIIIGDNTVYIY